MRTSIDLSSRKSSYLCKVKPIFLKQTQNGTRNPFIQAFRVSTTLLSHAASEVSLAEAQVMDAAQSEPPQTR
jgi:hypothetical protein